MRKSRLVLTCSCFGLLGLVAAIAGAVFFVGRHVTAGVARIRAFAPAARRLPEELAAARREGLPLEPSDLRRTPPVPAGRNAALLYVQMRQMVGATLTAKTDDEALLRLLKSTSAASDRAGAELLLSRGAALVALAEQAAAMPECDFQRRYELGPNLMLPEYATMRRAARMLALRARLQSADGDVAGAMRSIASGARIGGHAATDKILIGTLTCVSIDTTMDAAFERALLDHVSSREAVAAARSALAGFGEAPSLPDGLCGEIVMCRAVVRDIRSGRTSLGSLSIPTTLRLTPPEARPAMCDAWEARSVSYWRRVMGALRDHRSDMLAQYHAYRAIGDAEQALDGEPTYELQTMLLPVFGQAALKVMGDEARRRMRAALVDLVAYRQAHGSFPAALSDLGGGARLDPFTNRPLVYRREGGGFVLYGVGENLADDGGSAQAAPHSDQPLDIVVRYAPPR